MSNRTTHCYAWRFCTLLGAGVVAWIPGIALAAVDVAEQEGGGIELGQLGWIAVTAATLVAIFAWRNAKLRRKLESQSAKFATQATSLEKAESAQTLIADNHFAEIQALQQRLDELKKQADEVGKARDEAEAANRAKSQFLAMMSHELRTPLNAILGFSEIIRSEALGSLGCPEYRDYAGDIYTSGAHLLSVINDLLDLAKVESGMVDLREELVNPAIIIDETVRIVSKTEAARDVKLTAEPDPNMPKFRGDRRRMRQIMLNLVSNAAKFTSAGGSIRVCAYENAEGAIVLETIDTGIGIAEEDIERVMEPFVQLDSQLSREYHGTGLGLPLCKQLAELHGGTFEIESVINQGTTVRVTLPVERTVATPAPVERTPAAA